MKSWTNKNENVQEFMWKDTVPGSHQDEETIFPQGFCDQQNK